MKTCSSIDRWAYLGSPPFLSPSSWNNSNATERWVRQRPLCVRINSARWNHCSSSWGGASGIGVAFPFFTLLNKQIKLVGLSGIWWRLLEQMCAIWMPLAFHFMFTQAMGKLTPSGPVACYLSQVQARCFKASGFLPDRCVKPDVGMCQCYLGLVSHGSFAQHRYLGSSLFLQTFDGIALRSQNLPHKIELMATKRKVELAWWSKQKQFLVSHAVSNHCPVVAHLSKGNCPWESLGL